MPHYSSTGPEQDRRHGQSGQPHVRPFRITWHGKTYSVSNVNDYHTDIENGAKMHVFTATDGTGTFELTFSSEDVAWFLGE